MSFVFAGWPKHLLFALLLTVFFNATAQKVGVFNNYTDVGHTQKKGSTTYNPASQQYTLTGSGTNIWFNHDAFQYAWTKLKGNFIVQARVRFIGKGKEPHRKLGWMVRKSLDSNAAMACATVHGNGLTSLQYRPAADSNIAEEKFTETAPEIIQLERRGTRYIMSVAKFGAPFTTQEIELPLRGDVYVGLFVCAHNNNVLESATFSNVRITVPAKENLVAYKEYLGSNIELMEVQTGNREIVYSQNASLQAPNWMHDGKSLLYNSNGLIYKLDLQKREPEVINTDFVKNNNNDHVISFDGKMLGLSSASADPKWGSIVYTVPITGGRPKQLTPAGPSYLHGWSPDGKFLIYTGQRNNEFDIYKMPATGGQEQRLTTAPGLDDGSEYSPDGKYIYFNSVRSGTMQLWRMKPDGSAQEQLTDDAYNNWFPHVSPDGKWIVFLSFMQDVKPGDHPFYKHVYLRMIPANVKNSQPKVLAYIYGGQGTINTPSWSPDSKRIAFVSNTDMGD